MPDPWAPPPDDESAPWHKELPWDEGEDDPDWEDLEDLAGPEFKLFKRDLEED